VRTKVKQVAQYAPAPWAVGEIRMGYDCVIRNRDNDPVALTAWAGYQLPTARANARLIAAAPDLLEALKAFTDEAQREGAFPHEVAEARKAIAKAEGR
jgi:hypothetical protein